MKIRVKKEGYRIIVESINIDVERTVLVPLSVILDVAVEYLVYNDLVTEIIRSEARKAVMKMDDEEIAKRLEKCRKAGKPWECVEKELDRIIYEAVYSVIDRMFKKILTAEQLFSPSPLRINRSGCN